MITAQLIEEWIAEIEARPGSAPLVMRALGERLRELSRQNEALLTENLDLRSGKRADEYESRIANLEYQIELLKRQMGSEIDFNALDQVQSEESRPAETVSLLLYTSHGLVLRLEEKLTELENGATVGVFAEEVLPGGDFPYLLAAPTQEELLLIFDSGRSQTRAAVEFPKANSGALQWNSGTVVDCRGLEELANIGQIATLPFYEFLIQVSRRGYLKKFNRSFFETCIAKSYVGSGVRLPADQTGALVLANPDQRLVLVSQEGYLWSMPVSDLPITLEEAIRLGRSDHLVAALSLKPEDEILLVTDQGKLIHRSADWLKDGQSLKARGQAAYSKSRREAGVRLAGAGALSNPDAWGFALQRSGRINAYRIADLLSAGSVPLESSEQDALLGFAVYDPRIRSKARA